jgi:hypothetical protein
MALKWTQVGTNPDGSPAFTVTADSGHVLLTGDHSRGQVAVSDGTAYDVTPQVIEVESPEHAGEISHHIGVQHEQARRHGLAPEPVIGTHPVTGEDDVLIGAPHECTELCGPNRVHQPVHAGHLGLHKSKVTAMLKMKEG